MLDGITQAADRLQRYDVEVAGAHARLALGTVVRALMALRGFALLHAATLHRRTRRLQPLPSILPS